LFEDSYYNCFEYNNAGMGMLLVGAYFNFTIFFSFFSKYVFSFK